MISNVKIRNIEGNYFKITVEGNEFKDIPIDEVLDEEENSLYSIWIKNKEYDIREKISDKEVIVKLVG